MRPGSPARGSPGPWRRAVPIPRGTYAGSSSRRHKGSARRAASATSDGYPSSPFAVLQSRHVRLFGFRIRMQDKMRFQATAALIISLPDKQFLQEQIRMFTLEVVEKGK